MKRDRNSFFESSNYNMSAYQQPNMPYPMMNQTSSNFYAAQNMPVAFPNQNSMSPSNSTISELESKIAKLERSIHRLDARLSKLEGSSFYATENYQEDNNLYMV